MCRYPWSPGGLHYYPCGQCNPCRFNRRRLWTSRMRLESMKHDKNCFVTLTYNDASLPLDGSLSKRALQTYIKRLRKAIAPASMRYYGVGEYGDQSWRPHYHLIIFGLGLEDHKVISDAWSLDGKSLGFVHVGEFNEKTAKYVTGYVQKKLTKKDDGKLQTDDGVWRQPEFALMSRRPGIGASALKEIAAGVLSVHGKRALSGAGDVPTFIKLGGVSYPLGRYLRSKLRELVDVFTVDPETGEVGYGASLSSKKLQKEEMLVLFETWFNSKKDQAVSFKQYLTGLDQGKVALQEVRQQMRKQRKVL